REVFRQAIAEVKKTGSAKVVESSQEIDGAQTWFDTTYLPVMMRGKLAFLISIRRNRTPQRRAEQQLVEAAKAAGAAEVASGALHNVGNILTSIRVAASELHQRTTRAKHDTLKKVVDLLDENSDDLSSFFAPGELGAKIPGLLAALARKMDDEQEAQMTCIARLEGFLNHVTEVIRAQQITSKAAPINYRIPVKDLFVDALAICSASHPVSDEELSEDYADIFSMVGDPNKILQILVNLIGNARDSMGECKDRPGHLRLATRELPEDRIAFSVVDNGKGIDEQQIELIFQHGYTTKTDGHGFGLHSCATAAKEMDGSIQVSSEGVDRGATFSLILPRSGSEDSTE
ncbi:MAG: sensor histidine kinase, partial [Myxococcales bacterium]|nr:sensor histidine kinase [Myxococcales bacterium]